jgi:broad-specificity NMP kinase
VLVHGPTLAAPTDRIAPRVAGCVEIWWIPARGRPYARRVGATGIPVIWICGAPGAGKSAAAWALFRQLAVDGMRVAYVDIDQLGMLYPADDDPVRHRLKTDALAALVPGYASAGARVLVVSGVVDPKHGPFAGMADVNLTLCLLSPDPEVVRQRILDRGWGETTAEDAVAEVGALRHATFVDRVVETTGLSVAETANRLRASVSIGEPSADGSVPDVSSPAALGVVVVTGPRAAGSSTVGFGLASARWRADLPTGFVDLQQLAFLTYGDSPAVTNAALGIRQLAVMHTFMAAHGARLLVVSGHLTLADRAAIRRALRSSTVTVVRLRANRATFEAHVRDRVAGNAARLAGDDLLGAGREHQAAVVATALREQAHLDAYATSDAILDVTGRSPAAVVAQIEHIAATRA